MENLVSYHGHNDQNIVNNTESHFDKKDPTTILFYMINVSIIIIKLQKIKMHFMIMIMIINQLLKLADKKRFIITNSRNLFG